MVEEKIILQVLTEQRDEKNSFDTASWVARREESLIELDSPLAQIVIGVRRSGKSTLCHKVLIEHNINYAYANFDDDRLASMKTEDLNKEKKSWQEHPAQHWRNSSLRYSRARERNSISSSKAM